ncbi:MAG: DUF4112 domain-containing protein [Pyrinomonadaceae bacterium]
MQEIEEFETFDSQIGEVVTSEKQKQIELDQSLETLSYYLDGFLRVPGTGWRFGLDSMVGLIPNFGDISTALVSFYILVAGVKYGVPKITLLRMAFNIGFDYMVGVIPVIGDGFDFIWKSNKQNIELIRKRGAGRGKDTTGDWIFVFVVIALLIFILVGSVFVSVLILGLFFSGIYKLFSS